MKTIDQPRLHATKNDLPENARGQLTDLLNARLADAIDLMMQAKQAHWNVKGPNFIGLHELFDKVYEAAGEYVDLIAERAVQLGGTVTGTIRMAAGRTTLGEYPLEIVNGRDHVDAVSTALATFGRAVRMGVNEADLLGDADTADVLTEISRGTDKLLWFVEAHLEGKA
jgi:starvation-inducible DNA-binding protein